MSFGLPTGTPTNFVSVDGVPPSAERQRIEQLRFKRDEKWGAKEALNESIDYEMDCARRIEIRLYDSEYLGRTTAELAEIDPNTLADHAAPNRYSPLAQLREARQAATHREKAGRMQARLSVIAAEGAALGRLIESCEKHLSERGIQ